MRLSRFVGPAALGALVVFTLGAQCGGDGGGGTGVDNTRVISINAGNAQSAGVGTAVAIAPSVKVVNSTGAGVSGISVNFAIGSGGGQLTGNVQTTNSSGIATVGSWTLGNQIGSNTLTATAGGTTGGPITFTATAVAGAAKTIALSAGNGQSVILGSAVATAPAVLVTDAGGNPVSGTAVTFAIVTGGGSITGGSATTNASGIATIGSWTPGSLGPNTLSATSPGLTGNPITFTATAAVGPATKLAVTTVPSTTAVNRAALATQPVLQLQDVNGNSVSTSGVVVTAAITSGGGTLGGTTTATTNASGVATFTNLSIAGTVGARTISFTATGLTAATATVTTTAAAASTLAANAGNAQSANVGSAVAIAPSVIITDPDNNPISGLSVTFAVGVGGGSVTGATTTTNASGIATVGSWTLGAAGSNTLIATATTGFGATTPSITFSATGVATAATKLVMQTQPATAFTGAAFGTQPVVRITDAAGTTISAATNSVTAAIASGTGTLSGTTTVSAVAGVATFTNLAITGTGAFTITFTSTGLTSVTSASFTVNTPTGGASQIVMNTQPSTSATSGVAFTTQPVVSARDASNTVVTTYQSNVTASIASGSGTLSGTTTVQAIGGVATFTNLKITGTGAHTLSFASTGLTSATSGTITVAAPTVVSISKSSADTIATMAGAAIATKPSVTVLGTGGAPAAGVTVTFAVASGGGSITGGTATTDANGVATVGSWTMGATAQQNTLTATVAGSGITGNPVTFTAAGCSGSGAGFKITVCYVSDMTATQRGVFATAAAKWEGVISGDLSDITFSTALAAGACGTSAGGIAPGTVVDDLLIFAIVVPIDGAGGVLGNAGPCRIRTTGGLPVVGSMRFDTADLAQMESNLTLTPVITHEMGHVIGVGSLWDTKGLVTNATVTTALDTYYNGANGLSGFTAIGGNAYTGGQKVPVENTGGSGTANVHWRETVLKNELMTGFISATDGTNPLSLLTARSLVDLGYTINEAGADLFSPTFSIRAGGKSEQPIQLLNDIYLGPLFSLDARGRIVKRIR